MTNNVTVLPIAVKIGPFKNSGDFSITKSLKFGFSLFCRVLLLAIFFSYLFLFRVYFVVTNDLTILPASSVCVTDCYQKLVLLKTLENLVLRTVKNLVFLCSVEFCFSLFFRTCFYFVFFCFVSFFKQLFTIEKR